MFPCPRPPTSIATQEHDWVTIFHQDLVNPSLSSDLSATLPHRKDSNQNSTEGKVNVTTASEQSDRIATLDGLRAMAILLVIGSHAMDHEKYADLARGGIAGVMIFFALSGYLITTRLLSEYKKAGRIDLRNFYLRRAFRILPPAVTFLSVVWILSSLGIVECDGRSLLSALFFYANYVNLSDMAWRVGHFWSLSVEEHFYLIWPCLLIAFGVMQGWRTAASLAIAICLWRAADTHYHIAATAFGAPYLEGLGLRTDLLADTLLWGCCLAFCRFSLGPVISTCIVLMSFVSLVCFYGGLTDLVIAHNHIELFIHILPTILLGALVSCPKGAIAWFLDSPQMRFIGKLSYSLYIWQQLFLGGHGPRLPLPIALAAAFVCAYLSYRFVEQPCIRMGKQFTTATRRPVLTKGVPLPDSE
jgi:peptidoglycan/LPS O-acetylase OafA/YrhL